MPQGYVQETVKSPCINICALDNSRTLCVGCLRTLDEISAWSLVDNAGKQKILATCAQRKQMTDQQPSGHQSTAMGD